MTLNSLKRWGFRQDDYGHQITVVHGTNARPEKDFPVDTVAEYELVFADGYAFRTNETTLEAIFDWIDKFVIIHGTCTRCYLPGLFSSTRIW